MLLRVMRINIVYQPVSLLRDFMRLRIMMMMVIYHIRLRPIMYKCKSTLNGVSQNVLPQAIK